MSSNALTKDQDSSQDELTVFLRKIQLRNLLSFGPDTPLMELMPLNVVIGPNGSGKSNLIDAICLQRASASNIRDFVRTNGGVKEWIWKGDPLRPASVDFFLSTTKRPLDHFLAFVAGEDGFRVDCELIMSWPKDGEMVGEQIYYNYYRGNSDITVNKEIHVLDMVHVKTDRSILSQLRDPLHYPEITALAEQYENIRVYREWSFGRNTVFRQPQAADGRTDRLEEDFSNLGIFLNRLRRTPQVKKKLLTYLRDVYDGIDDFDVSVEGGTVQVFFTEGEFTIPATRLSDGTLRYLCLLAILCDPTPPPLICIEEPELGLHPDIIPKLADLLKEASQRTQLIVTTHSDILVDAMSDQPESVLVCEKHDGQTQFKRPNPAELSVWLEKYRLHGDMDCGGPCHPSRDVSKRLPA